MAKYISEPKTRVVMIEGNAVEQEYLAALISGVSGVILSNVYNSLEGAMAEFQETLPDLVILDLDGFMDFETDWIRELHRRLPHTALLMLSSEQSHDQVFSTFEAGISGWLQKPCTADQIVRAIFVLREGGAILGNQLARQVLDYFNARGKSVDGPHCTRAGNPGAPRARACGAGYRGQAVHQQGHHPHARAQYPG